MAAEPRRLVLLRHGRTAWNTEGRAQGHADVELDEVGHAQAAAVAPHLAALDPVTLWSSDLARARQTAAYVEKETGLEARLDHRLREYDVGERTGLTVPEFAARLPDEHAAWQAGGEDALAAAETTAQVLARTVPACRALMASVEPGAAGIVVAHGAALKMTVLALLGWEAALAPALEGLGNCAAAVVSAPGPAGPYRLVAWNTRPDFASWGAGR